MIDLKKIVALLLMTVVFKAAGPAMNVEGAIENPIPVAESSEPDYTKHQWELLAKELGRIDFGGVTRFAITEIAEQQRQPQTDIAEQISIEHLEDFERNPPLDETGKIEYIDESSILDLAMRMIFKTKENEAREGDDIKRIMELLFSLRNIELFVMALEEVELIIKHGHSDSDFSELSWLLNRMPIDTQALAIREGRRLYRLTRRMIDENRDNPTKTYKWKQMHPIMKLIASTPDDELMPTLLGLQEKHDSNSFRYVKPPNSPNDLIKALCTKFDSYIGARAYPKTRWEIVASVRYALQDPIFAACARNLAQYIESIPEDRRDSLVNCCMDRNDSRGLLVRLLREEYVGLLDR